MILADSTIWVDHLRHGDPLLAARLNDGLIFIHPFVMGEIALGSLRQRETVLGALRGLPLATLASDEEVAVMIERTPLFSLGIGYVDAHLLASTRLSPGMRLWTRDRRLRDVAAKLGLADPSAS